MASSLNLSLTDELRAFVNENSGDGTLYATPSEYVRDLLRQQKLRQEAAAAREAIIDGYQDAIAGRTAEFKGDLKSLLKQPKECANASGSGRVFISLSEPFPTFSRWKLTQLSNSAAELPIDTWPTWKRDWDGLLNIPICSDRNRNFIRRCTFIVREATCWSAIGRTWVSLC